MIYCAIFIKVIKEMFDLLNFDSIGRVIGSGHSFLAAVQVTIFSTLILFFVQAI
jgi:hypothetical protein